MALTSAATAVKRGDSRLAAELTSAEVLSGGGAGLGVAFTQFVSTQSENPTTVWRTMHRERGAASIGHYAEMEEKADHFGAEIEKRREAVLGKPTRVEPASESARDQAIADFCQEMLDDLPSWESTLSEALDSLGKGVSIAELMYETDGRRIVVADIRFRPQRFFAFGAAGQPETGGLRLAREDSDADVFPVNKFFVCTFQGRQGNRWGRPLARRCYWPTWFLRQGLRFWLKFAERGTGVVVAKYPAVGQEKENLVIAAKALEAAQAANDETAIAIPENFLLEFQQAARQGGGSGGGIYGALTKRMEAAISKIILGQTLTTSGSDEGAGSRATAQVHNDIRQEKVEADARWLSGCVQRQVLAPVVALNFGPDADVPRFVIEAEEGEDAAEAADLMRKLADMGGRVSVGYAHGRLSIPIAEEGEDTLRVRGPLAATAALGADGKPGAEFVEGAEPDPEPDAVIDQSIEQAKAAYGAATSWLIEQAALDFPEVAR